MAILMIDYQKDNLIGFSGSSGYLMVSVPPSKEKQYLFSVKILDNDRNEELGYIFLNPDNSLCLLRNLTSWDE